MSICAVAECKNTTKIKCLGNTLSFHRFPKDELLAKGWLAKCRRKDTVNISTARICSDHFVQTDFIRDLKNELLGLPTKRILKSDSTPSVFIFRNQLNLHSTNRAKRLTTRLVKQQIDHLTKIPTCVNTEVPSEECNYTDETELNPESKELILDDEILKLQITVQYQDKRISELELVVQKQRRQILFLQASVRSLKQGKKGREDVSGQFLSAAQQKKVEGLKRVNWNLSDIQNALAIRSVSVKAFKTATKMLNVPLPSLRTLQKWSQRFTCEEGMLVDVLAALREVTKDMNPISKLAVLSFDEMSLDSTFTLDPTFQKIVSHSKVQVAMIRGLCDKWKQPVYYEFNRNMTLSLLNTIITKVEETGIQVHALVCDLGNENRSLLKSLEISIEKVEFVNPAEPSRSVLVFPDVPHCLKNIRNHILDQGAVLEDGTKINKDVLLAMIDSAGTELKLCPNISLASLELTGAERMRVRPAAQLLSHRVATLAWKCYPKNRSVGNFFEIINNGFDVLNSRCTFDSRQNLKSGFGVSLENQTKCLNDMKHLMENTRFTTNKGNPKKALLPCQWGFIISITSLMKLFNNLKISHGLRYILSSRLNQDGLENFFSRIRSFGGPNSHPSAPEFRYRMRLTLLGSQIVTPRGSNVDEWENNNKYLTTILLKSSQENKKEEIEKSIETEVLQNLDGMGKRKCGDKFNDVELDSLRYLAGYLAWKLRKQGLNYGTFTKNCKSNPPRATKTLPWIEMLSRGGLIVPNNIILTATHTLEKEFRNLFPVYERSNFCSTKLFHHIRRLHPSIDERIIKEYLRTRMRIKVRLLNNNRKFKGNINLRKKIQFVKSK